MAKSSYRMSCRCFWNGAQERFLALVRGGVLIVHLSAFIFLLFSLSRRKTQINLTHITPPYSSWSRALTPFRRFCFVSTKLLVLEEKGKHYRKSLDEPLENLSFRDADGPVQGEWKGGRHTRLSCTSCRCSQLIA